MNLDFNAFGKDPQNIDLESQASGLQELAEAGGIGTVRTRVQVTPLAGDSYLVQGQTRGDLNLDCGRCLDKIQQSFVAQFNLLIEKRKEKGLEWLEDEEQGVEDYQVRIGPDIMDIPLDHIIAEQVLLNYNLHPLPALDALNCCLQCGRLAPVAGEKKRADRVDPRWAGLKALKEIPGKKALKKPDAGKKRGKP